MSESGLVPVRVVFPIGQDSDGYPPYSEEGVWVRPITCGVGEVLSIPFFVVSVSKGDLISYRMEGGRPGFLSCCLRKVTQHFALSSSRRMARGGSVRS